MTLAEQLDGARYVKYDEDRGYVLAWYGGFGFNAYDAGTGDEVAHWNLAEEPNFWAAQEEIHDQIQSGNYLEYF